MKITWTRRAWLAFAALGLLATLIGLTRADTGAALAEGQDAPLTVRLIIDFNDGLQKHFTALPWDKGMTALDAMEAAKAHPRGITFTFKGEGETAFLTDIDGVKNQGAAGDGRNWQYWVNTSFGDRSFGAAVLQPGDVVLWKHDTYRGRP